MKTSIKLCRRQLSCSTSVAALFAGAVIAIWISPAEATTPDWTGATSGNWFVNGNWSTNLAPAAADTAFIDTTTPNAPTVNGGTANVLGLAVGFNHTGTLTILNGGVIADQNGDIGYNVGSNGAATVAGANSLWSSSSFLTVGTRGSETLAVSGGGTVTDNNATIGSLANSTGIVTVDGSGSSWTTQIG